jgi:hypothetical protein
MSREYKRSPIKFIGLGKESSQILQQFDFLDSGEFLSIDSKKEMQKNKIFNFCKNTDLVCIAVDLNNIFARKYLLDMVSFLSNHDMRVLTVIKNADSQSELTKRIKQYASIVDVSRQENDDASSVLHQVYCAFLNHADPIRALDDEFSIQRFMELYFEDHQEIYIYSDTSLPAFPR